MKKAFLAWYFIRCEYDHLFCWEGILSENNSPHRQECHCLIDTIASRSDMIYSTHSFIPNIHWGSNIDQFSCENTVTRNSENSFIGYGIGWKNLNADINPTPLHYSKENGSQKS